MAKFIATVVLHNRTQIIAMSKGWFLTTDTLYAKDKMATREAAEERVAAYKAYLQKQVDRSPSIYYDEAKALQDANAFQVTELPPDPMEAFDAQGKPFKVGQKVAVASKFYQVDGLHVVIKKVTRVVGPKIYLDDSGTALRFPERVAIVSSR